jgi:hypothetical protein
MSEVTAPAKPRGARQARRIAGRTVRRWLVDVSLIAIGVTSVVFEPISIAIHSVVGLVFVAMVGPHLWDRRRWIRGTFARIRHRRQMPASRRWNLAQGLLLLLLAVAVTVSGLWDWLDVPTKIRYHAITGVILIGIATWHSWTRRRALVRWGSARRRPGRGGRAQGLQAGGVQAARAMDSAGAEELE